MVRTASHFRIWLVDEVAHHLQAEVIWLSARRRRFAVWLGGETFKMVVVLMVVVAVIVR